MRKKLNFFLIISMLMLACLLGCNVSRPTTDPTEHKVYLPTEESVRLLGRATLQEDTLWMVHSGTGMEFYAVGERVKITFLADSNWETGGGDKQARIAIYLNGIRVADEMIDEKEKTVTVTLGKKDRRNIVRVVKLSEAAHSTCGITQIEVYGEIEPTEEKEKLIEFIGDSITCGYGIDDEVPENAFSTTTEDVTKTFAYKTAETLEADYSMVALSGHGVISGNTKNGVKSPDRIMPAFYEKIGFCKSTYLEKYVSQDMVWDFTKRQPDLIVINLGTNDKTYVKGDAEKTEEFILGYIDFLKQVRQQNPEATILCTLGMMGADLNAAMEEAVGRYQAETSDGKVFSMLFENQSSSDGRAAGWHPTERTNEKAAQRLVEEIQKIMGW